MWSHEGRWILFRRGSQLLKALASGGTEPSDENSEIDDSSRKSERGRAVVARRAHRDLLGGRRPWTPDHAGYYDTVRARRVSPDSNRLRYARRNPTADIWIREGIGGRTPPAR